MPQIQEQIPEVAEIVPQRRIPERIVEHTRDVPVPQIHEQIVEVVKKSFTRRASRNVLPNASDPGRDRRGGRTVEHVVTVKNVPLERISEGFLNRSSTPPFNMARSMLLFLLLP